MRGVRRITVILNVGSGHRDAAECETQIREGLCASDCPVQIRVAKSAQEVRAQVAQTLADAQRDEVICAAGGDGTINLVASLILGRGVPLGVIPLGTFNYFARDLGIPLEPREAAAALATGRPRSVHVARVNGHLFLNNASFGLYRQLLEERERSKQRFGRYKLVAVFSALHTLWRFRHVYTLDISLDGESRVIRTPMLFFGLNSLQLEKLDLDVARCARAGQLAVIALQPVSRWHLLGLAMKGALQGLHDSPDLRCHGASQVLVRQPGRGSTRVAVDGESFECRMPLRIEVLPHALEVIVPREPELRQ